MSGKALAITAGELLAQCEQLEKVWVIQGNGVSIPITSAGMNGQKCLGYLSAYHEMAYMKWADPDDPDAPPTPVLHACLPKGIDNVQLIRMFLKKARNNPAELHMPPFPMIVSLLIESFPCPK
jgi:hypothetical protein